MKRIKILFICVCCLFGLTLCSCFGNNSTPEDTAPTEYTIQYTDSLGQHTITVTKGSAYSIESIPTKTGYVFAGLYDAEEGGTQYVNASGSALSVFTDNKNLILFPQFKPKEYTVILDYQGAVVTGTRSMKVEYDSILGSLPMNLSLENKEFTGWYTEANCKGKQIADQYGVLPATNKITEKNFNLDDVDGNIYLYAGFKGKEYTVTFYAGGNSQSEEIRVEHGTPISEVVPTNRVDGKAVLSWSKSNGGEVFDGKVTDDLILYAVEYAPVLDFDTQGGDDINPLIARSGDTITLPTPTKDNYKFIEWQDANKNTYSSRIMPSESKKLYAKWQAILVFETRGGTEVENISMPKGEKIVLPTTDKDGYIFAGWYDSNNKLYESSSMPETSVILKAKYYKVLTEKISLIGANTYEAGSNADPSMYNMSTINLSNLYSKGIRKIKITAHFCVKLENKEGNLVHMAWFSKKEASAAYKVWEYTTNANSSTYTSHVFTTTIELTNDILYACYYDTAPYCKSYWKDFWIEVEYPDMSQLY